MGILTKTKSLAEFLDEYLNYKMNRAAFKHIGINITAKCNLDCVFCECRSLDSKCDLTFDEIKKFFAEMAARGARSVLIGGGEPFIRKDIWEILTFLKTSGYDISIVSNGLILADTPPKNLEIINETVSALSISLDSPKPELHSYYRNNKNAFDKAVRTIDRVVKLSKTKLLLTMIITKDNYREIPNMIDFAKQHGVGSVCFQPFSEATNFPDLPPKDKKQFLLDSSNVDELKHVYDTAMSRARDLGIDADLNMSKDWIVDYFSNKDTNCSIFQNMVNRFDCVLPFDELYVRHNGDVQLCALLPKISSIREKKLSDVIKDVQKRRRVLKQGEFPSECRRCFCGLNRNVRFSILSHPVKNYTYLKKILFPPVE